MDRQTKAVETAIEGWLPNDGLAYPTEQMAQAAIAASDARFVPMLVEALKAFQRGDASIQRIVAEALEQLPEDLRK